MSADADSQVEILQIRHELDILRTRYGLMKRWAVATKYAAFLFAMALLAIETFAIIVFNVAAMAAAALFIFVVLFACIMFWGTDARWIDFISMGIRFGRMRQSEARAIEQMIAEREAQLRTLSQ